MAIKGVEFMGAAPQFDDMAMHGLMYNDCSE